jgi:UDP-glucose 4-epimerase
MATILLTGATGYIASHTWLELQAAGYDVVGLDDFSNSSPEVLNRLEQLSGKSPVFERASVCDADAMNGVFERHRIDAVVHFAAFKAVGESTQQPLRYYANNIGGLLTLAAAMRAHDVNRIVFSSSATVYGKPEVLPIREDAATGATNPYGETKLIGEKILRDMAAAEAGWQSGILRYFNPVGAHESGRIGEDPRGVPNNLMPYVAQVAIGRRARLSVFGDDYDTPDGTGVRDYIHVVDLALGHVKALDRLLATPGSLLVNLGTGRGYSVLELIAAYEKASDKPVPYDIVARRAGDIDSCFADPALALSELGWKATRDLDAMCADSWRWQAGNPNGFDSGP